MLEQDSCNTPMSWVKRSFFTMPIPVIDVFAGPGGLGEGFCDSHSSEGRRRFRVALSIEKDVHAHKTLQLRAFFREFNPDQVPEEYYCYLRGSVTREELFHQYAEQAQLAERQAWHAELGAKATPQRLVDHKIQEALAGEEAWVLIGGPPCQAYSTAGRSKIRDLLGEEFEKDPRHLLYREFLRIVTVHRPPVFVMENVEGILSSKLDGENIFQRILSELEEPHVHARLSDSSRQVAGNQEGYRIFPLAAGKARLIPSSNMSDFLVRCEDYGVPQTRHRVILLGVRNDIKAVANGLPIAKDTASIWDVIADLPKVRSGLTRENDSSESWIAAVKSVTKCSWFKNSALDSDVRRAMLTACDRLDRSLDTGAEFVQSAAKPRFLREWYHDERLQGICNHSARLHMREDLHRYLFVSCFAQIHRRSPVLRDFPKGLLPNHKNALKACEMGTRLFADRFRVHLQDSPARTITSHILHDGHYFIHPDPSQCRSLTVREAARLQTFPDNYFFEGPRTEQYRQVGNAVPPYLARAIAGIVHDVIEQNNRMQPSEAGNNLKAVR